MDSGRYPLSLPNLNMYWQLESLAVSFMDRMKTETTQPQIWN